ncbi:MAG: potassium-transporting ATPase subunit KdpC [Fimbriimonadaceae bacterium]
MKDLVRPCIVLTLLLAVLCGAVYPAVVTVFSQTVFPHEANGSLIKIDDVVRGSKLIGQEFSSDGLFHSRPSSTEPPYNPSESGGSNLSPRNPELVSKVRDRAEWVRTFNEVDGDVPIDLVTSSASGLDPHISVGSARLQIPRVSRNTGIPENELLALVRQHTADNFLGVSGELAVNVVTLNVELLQTLEKRQPQ